MWIKVLLVATTCSMLLTGCTNTTLTTIGTPPIETIMNNYSANEIAEYFADNHELRDLAEAVSNVSDGEYYCLHSDDADELVFDAYAYGYYHGAVRDSETRDEWWDESSYAELTDAINRRDLDTIRDYTMGSYYASDFLE